MKTATVRDLRNRYTEVMRWLAAGENVAIKRRGQVIAHLVPPTPATAAGADWSASAAVRRNRRQAPRLTATESAAILRDSQG